MWQTDRRTDDGQNYDSQDRASIAASRGKNTKVPSGCKQIEAVCMHQMNRMNSHSDRDHDDGTINIVIIIIIF